MSDVRLYVNNQIYTGWKTVSVTRAIDQAANTFAIGLTSDFDINVGVLPVAPGSACRLELQGEIVVTGFVDAISGSFSESSHTYSVTGRSKIGDLIDCSAIVDGGEFRNQTVDAIAAALCKPFGISVVVNADVGSPLAVHRVDDGGAHEVIERACRRRGLLLFSSATGRLIIGEVSSEKISTPLEVGKNIKSGSGQFSINSRFSEYRVKGQANDSDEDTPLEQQVQALGIARDPNVKRYRPMVVDAEDGETNLTKRAQFEASTRLGRSTKMTYVVQGWAHNGGLWEPNKLVRVKDTYFGVDGLFLISAVSYRYSESGGTEADITVMPREAFKVQILKENNASEQQDWGDIFGDNAISDIGEASST